MDIPSSFREEKNQHFVCRLKKSLYGLKQSLRAWFGKLLATMHEMDYRQSNSDHTLFFKHSRNEISILLVYIDDMIFTRDDLLEIEMLNDKLSTCFKIKRLGNLKYFLGMEIVYSRCGIFLPHPPVDRRRYQRLIGKLIYLSHTQPDITYTIGLLSQFMHDLREVHNAAARRVLFYLKGTSDRRSTSGYYSFLGGNLIMWCDKKQPVVSRSSVESELRAMTQGLCEVLWIKGILEDLKIQYDSPTKLFCDNKLTIDIAHNPIHHDRTKHVEVNCHFIKEKIKNGILTIQHIRSEEQCAYIFTKGLYGPTMRRLLGKLGMENIHSPT
ncbi:unnamed protein product [Spirodela intermedia]|uniref:Reverse transcriptase Ty1/copia-type domain-containing protein n=1 Tax=Spirodela intermedia TaxID=51605 RepID=A0A7I8J3Q8_SPIIN|nr:unnamed protein product [Spirodela intermedia]CAA6664730.1 unnamed protein product [Spirodela intermedia]